MCQNVHPLQAGNPWRAAPTEWIEPLFLSEIRLPSALTLAIHLFLKSVNNSPGKIRPFSKSEPKGINPKKIGLEQTGVTLKFYNLNKINTASLPKFEEIKKNLLSW